MTDFLERYKSQIEKEIESNTSQRDMDYANFVLSRMLHTELEPGLIRRKNTLVLDFISCLIKKINKLGNYDFQLPDFINTKRFHSVDYVYLYGLTALNNNYPFFSGKLDSLLFDSDNSSENIYINKIPLASFLKKKRTPRPTRYSTVYGDNNQKLSIDEESLIDLYRINESQDYNKRIDYSTRNKDDLESSYYEDDTEKENKSDNTAINKIEDQMGNRSNSYLRDYYTESDFRNNTKDEKYRDPNVEIDPLDMLHFEEDRFDYYSDKFISRKKALMEDRKEENEYALKYAEETRKINELIDYIKMQKMQNFDVVKQTVMKDVDSLDVANLAKLLRNGGSHISWVPKKEMLEVLSANGLKRYIIEYPISTFVDIIVDYVINIIELSKKITDPIEKKLESLLSGNSIPEEISNNMNRYDLIYKYKLDLIEVIKEVSLFEDLLVLMNMELDYNKNALGNKFEELDDYVFDNRNHMQESLDYNLIIDTLERSEKLCDALIKEREKIIEKNDLFMFDKCILKCNPSTTYTRLLLNMLFVQSNIDMVPNDIKFNNLKVINHELLSDKQDEKQQKQIALTKRLSDRLNKLNGFIKVYSEGKIPKEKFDELSDRNRQSISEIIERLNSLNISTTKREKTVKEQLINMRHCNAHGTVFLEGENEDIVHFINYIPGKQEIAYEAYIPLYDLLETLLSPEVLFKMFDLENNILDASSRDISTISK